MEWRQWSQQLMEVLGLRRLPVAITYSDDAPAGASTGKCRACSALTQAAKGKVIDLSAENSICPGGSQYLGLVPQPAERAKTLREFLIHGEKLFASPVAIHRMTALAKVKPPFGLATHVIFAPLEQAELRPDVVVFHCNPWQAARLVNLAWYESGLPMECDPTGSSCRSIISYPLVTGKVNVSLGDITARKSEKIPEDELYVTLPFADLRSAVANLDACGAGRAKAEIPGAMRRMMQEAGGELPEL